MNVYFDLHINDCCVLQITDKTQQQEEYLKEESNDYITTGQFKYTDTYTINVVKYVSTKSTDIVEIIITPHVDEEQHPIYLDEAYFKLDRDGHYIIDHLVIPSVKCVQTKTKSEDYEGNNGIRYACDGERFYIIEKGAEATCNINEILESEVEITTVSKSSQDIFSMCHTKKKYLELCKEYLCTLIKNPCMNKNNAHNLDIDLIWMSLNAIKYYVECKKFNQAQALLEEIYKCTGIANLANTLKNQINYGCKCCS